MEAYARAFPGGRHIHAAEQRAVSLRSMLQSVDSLAQAAEEDYRAGRFDEAIGKWKRAVLTDPTRQDLRRRIRQAEAEVAEPPDFEDEDDSTQDIPAPIAPPLPPLKPPAPSFVKVWLTDPARRARLRTVLMLAGIAILAAGGLWTWFWLDNMARIHKAREYAATGRPEAAMEEYRRSREMPFLPDVPPMPREWEEAATQKQAAIAASTPAVVARDAAEKAEAPAFVPERWARAERLLESARAAWSRHSFAEACQAWGDAGVEFQRVRSEAETRAAELRAALKGLDAARAACEAADAANMAGAQWTSATGLAQSARAAWERRSIPEARANCAAARTAFDLCLKEARNAAGEKQAASRSREECGASRDAAVKVEASANAARSWDAAEQRRREGEAALEKGAFAAARMAFDAAKSAYEDARSQSISLRDARAAATAAREVAEAARTAADAVKAAVPKAFSSAERTFADAGKQFDAGDFAQARTSWETARGQFAVCATLNTARTHAIEVKADAEKKRSVASRRDARTLASHRWQAAEAIYRQVDAMMAEERFEAAAKSLADASQEYTAAAEEAAEKTAQRDAARQEQKNAADSRAKAVQCKTEEYARADWATAERLNALAVDAFKKGDFSGASLNWHSAVDRYATARRTAQGALQWAYDDRNGDGRRAAAERRFVDAVDAWRAAKGIGALLDTKPEDLAMLDHRITDCDRGLRVPDGFRAADAAKPDKGTGWADRIIHIKSGIELVFIPRGSFLMGQQEPDETPVGVVNITQPFYLGKCEVTQGEWRRITAKNPSRHTGDDRLPVDSVSWNACQDFLKEAGNGLRLPTEAEWEYACRAWTQTAYNVGDSLRTSQANFSVPKSRGWFGKDADAAASMPVGSYPPNAWGVFDMHGNVAEWCQDWYDAEGYRRRRIDDPMGAEQGTARVLRGGSFRDVEADCRSAHRASADPSEAPETAGFRVAVTCPE